MRNKKPKQDSGPASRSQRQLRVGELIRHAVAEMLSRGEVHDPVIETHLITVPEVRMTADLKLATIYVMPLGGKDVNEVIAALNNNKRFLRGEIAHRVNLKFAPDIRFRADERFDEAERIEKLLRTPQVQRDLETDARRTMSDEQRSDRRHRIAHLALRSSRQSLSAPRRGGDTERARTQEQASSSTAATSATSMAGWCSTSRSA